MSAKLLVEMPKNWAFSVELEPGRKYSAGRDPRSDIHLPNPQVLPIHAHFFERDGRWVVSRAQGLSGIVVSGEKVPEASLKDGDVINIGWCLMRFLNPSAADNSDWKKTGELVEFHQNALKKAIDTAETSKDVSAIMALAPDSASRFGESLLEGEDEEGPTPRREQGLLWVGNQLVEILGEVLTHPGNPESVYKLMLGRLRSAVGADNGFIMIPDEGSQRWVIRAWVGDTVAWTGNDKAFPVPLTVANKAFETRKVISNTLPTGRDPEISTLDPSASMIRLNVNSYVAVPILDGDVCRGVMYFDTRDLAKEFEARDVKLLAWAGSYIVEIENRAA